MKTLTRVSSGRLWCVSSSVGANLVFALPFRAARSGRTRGSPLLALIAVLALIACAASCNAVSGHREGPVNHVVICWLKSAGDPQARQELIEASKAFEQTIPGIVRVAAGDALPSTRPVVDSSYDVGIVMIFRDEESLRVFEHHPVHMQAVEKTLKPLVARFIVYDFVDR